VSKSLFLLIPLLSGCVSPRGMSRQEIMNAVETCRRFGLEPIITWENVFCEEAPR
jgi:hypothetical protein